MSQLNFDVWREYIGYHISGYKRDILLSKNIIGSISIRPNLDDDDEPLSWYPVINFVTYDTIIHRLYDIFYSHFKLINNFSSIQEGKQSIDQFVDIVIRYEKLLAFW